MPRRLSWLISIPTLRAAWLPSPTLHGKPTVRAAHHSSAASGGSSPFDAAAVPLPPTALSRVLDDARGGGVQLNAMCDRRSRTCRLFTSEARGGAPVMQQAECAAPAAEGASEEMAKQYSPMEVEQRLYEWWESSGTSSRRRTRTRSASSSRCRRPTSPASCTWATPCSSRSRTSWRASPHARHPTLWLPGTDHAGIATQMLVERALRADGIERKEIGREKFLERVWDWKGEYGGYITGQIRRLGASCDWTREKFTLQPELCEAVTEAFVTLHERGLIYRGEYMVNWSPSLGTAVSDLEVDYTEEQGSLYYFKYRLAENPDEHIAVATTRPETILGDAAVCVHPEDERYTHLVGKEVLVPILDRKIPVIADDYVQMDFGSGALKITPAHDVNDYAIEAARPADGQHLREGRDAQRGGRQVRRPRPVRLPRRPLGGHGGGRPTLKVEAHTQRVPRSERSGEVIEPMLSSQWFVKMDGMAAKGCDAVRNGDIQIIPERFEKTYFNWLENIQDWCVSRQLWWGHRIRCGTPRATAASTTSRAPRRRRRRRRRPSSARASCCARTRTCSTRGSRRACGRATVGWPASEGAMLQEYNRFYPSSVMETGYDILFFWVARMVMSASSSRASALPHDLHARPRARRQGAGRCPRRRATSST